MKKILIALILVISSWFVLIIRPFNVSAEGEFITDINVEYQFDDNGKANIISNFTLENTVSTIYAASYLLTLQNIEPESIKAYEGGKPLKIATRKEDTKTTVEVTFDEPIVGKGSKHQFSILFTNNNLAQRTGDVWEIYIPRLGNPTNFRNSIYKLTVPNSFGNEAYISPKPTRREKGQNSYSYVFENADTGKTGITAGFGNFQVFSFTLNYHIENPISKTAYVEIALPADTSTQKIYYQKISPEPDNVRVDEDGNWLGIYKLSDRERIDVQAVGSVQIFANSRNFMTPTEENLRNELASTEYWQVDNLKIHDLALSLKTPRSIYDYVVNNLSYDYERVKPNAVRLGAVGALENPKNAICTEFTDLFIALSRAAGIPAREINGYAYTENTKIQPLSMVADVLHSWPEYWNKETKTWIPVDPTWGSTTKGINFFDKLDLRHFTFVTHGRDAVKPYAPGSYKLGANPQKDVFVSFGQLPEKTTNKPQLSLEITRAFPYLSEEYLATIKNPGPNAIYKANLEVLFDNKTTKLVTIDVLPPYGSYELQSSIPYSFLGKNVPDMVKFRIEGQEIASPSHKTQFIVANILVILLLLLIITIIIVWRLRKIHFIVFARIKSFLFRKSNHDKGDTVTPQI
jgi:hypothetical protein